MPSFHPLNIKDIRRETDQCVSIAFNIPNELQDEFKYKPGQYLTLRMRIKGEEVRRSYSLCSSPAADSDYRIAVKAVENGKASNFLNNEVKAGDIIDVMKPTGNFTTEMPADKDMHFVAFAAGSGITPIISLLKSALKANTKNRFTLFYGNREAAQVIFKEELNALQNQFGSRLAVHHIFSREHTTDPLFNGRISAEKCSELMARFDTTTSADHYFLCGPFDMITAIRNSLSEKGIADEKVHFELFTTEAPNEDKNVSSQSDGGSSPVDSSQVTVILDGEETVVEVTKADNILDAILDAGLDAPYACTGGSCCTCRAKVLKGNAIMDVNYALTEKEVENGYILTCQSHPTTAEMVVDYDAP